MSLSRDTFDRTSEQLIANRTGGSTLSLITSLVSFRSRAIVLLFSSADLLAILNAVDCLVFVSVNSQAQSCTLQSSSSESSVLSKIYFGSRFFSGTVFQLFCVSLCYFREIILTFMRNSRNVYIFLFNSNFFLIFIIILINSFYSNLYFY